MRASSDNCPMWARIVSNLLSPPLVLSALVIAIAQRDARTSSQAAMLVSLYFSLGVAVPVLYVAWMVYRGDITDLHMPERRERRRPMIVTFASSTLVLAGFLLLNAPGGLIFLAIFSLVANAILGIITIVWQISVHGTTIAGVVTMVAVLLSAHTALILSPSIVLVGAARLRLKRHTPAEILAGVGLGVSLVVLIAALLHW